jgi:hypothetical protein
VTHKRSYWTVRRIPACIQPFFNFQQPPPLILNQFVPEKKIIGHANYDQLNNNDPTVELTQNLSQNEDLFPSSHRVGSIERQWFQ